MFSTQEPRFINIYTYAYLRPPLWSPFPPTRFSHLPSLPNVRVVSLRGVCILNKFSPVTDRLINEAAFSPFIKTDLLRPSTAARSIPDAYLEMRTIHLGGGRHRERRKVRPFLTSFRFWIFFSCRLASFFPSTNYTTGIKRLKTAVFMP